MKENRLSFKEFPDLNPHDQPLKESLRSDAFQVNRDRLNFGVELEFTIAGLDEKYADPTPHDTRSVRGILGSTPYRNRGTAMEILEHVVSVLKQAGIPAEARVGSPPSQYNEMINPWIAKDQISWIVTSDDSIEPPKGHNTNYVFHNIEITSPAFYFSKVSQAAVAQVCALLSNTFRINNNDTSALHVHVGHGTKGFAPQTVRHAMATAFTFEPQIENIHPSDYRGLYMYGPSIRDMSRLRNLQEWEDRLPPSGTGFSDEFLFKRENRYLSKSLGRILEAKDIKSVKNLLTHKNGSLDREHQPRMAYNLNYLVDPQPGTIGVEGSKKTIEFRQHEGTVDPTRVTNWIRCCVGLMEFADTVAPPNLRLFLRRNIQDRLNIMNMGMICTALGMFDIAQYYNAIVGEGKYSMHYRDAMRERRSRNPEEWDEGLRLVQVGFNELNGEPIVVYRKP